MTSNLAPEKTTASKHFICQLLLDRGWFLPFINLTRDYTCILSFNEHYLLGINPLLPFRRHDSSIQCLYEYENYREQHAFFSTALPSTVKNHLLTLHSLMKWCSTSKMCILFLSCVKVHFPKILLESWNLP